MRTKDLGDIGLKLTSISSTDRERKKALYIIFYIITLITTNNNIKNKTILIYISMYLTAVFNTQKPRLHLNENHIYIKLPISSPLQNHVKLSRIRIQIDVTDPAIFGIRTSIYNQFLYFLKISPNKLFVNFFFKDFP